MEKQRRGRMLAWLAVILWMAVIFLFSAQVGKDSSHTSGRIVRWVLGLLYWHFEDFSPQRQESLVALWGMIIRKGAHFTEFAVLGALLSNALRTYTLSAKQRWLLPVGIGALYAVSDEIHQYFVPDRACRFLDVCIDTSGVLFGTALFLLAVYLWKKKSSL